MAEWHISHKVAAIVSDNAANVVSAVRLGEWRSIGCFAHSLNLVVHQATKEISVVLTQVKSIEFFVAAHTEKKLEATQQQMNLPVLKLKQHVPTRWNSTFDLLQRIVQVKDAVIASCTSTIRFNSETTGLGDNRRSSSFTKTILRGHH